MLNISSIIRRCALALALTGMALAAHAGPINFHVALNTSTLPDNGFVDFAFTKGGSDAQSGSVLLSNLSSAFTGVDFSTTGVADHGNGSYSINNFSDFWNDLTLATTFGGVLSFDLAFDQAFLGATGIDGSTLAVSLLDSNYLPVGGDFGVAFFELIPASGDHLAAIGTSAVEGLATISAVPEPSQLLLVLTALAAVMLLRRQRN